MDFDALPDRWGIMWELFTMFAPPPSDGDPHNVGPALRLPQWLQVRVVMDCTGAAKQYVSWRSAAWPVHRRACARHRWHVPLLFTLFFPGESESPHPALCRGSSCARRAVYSTQTFR